MKMTQSLVNSLLVCGVTLAMTLSVSAQTTNRTAKAVRVHGSARYSMNNGADWNELTTGAVLKEGAIVQTDRKSGSYVDLVLGEGKAVAMAAPGGGKSGPGGAGGGGHSHSANVDLVRLYPDTALGIDKLTATPTGAGVQTETQLDLRKGHVTGNVKKMVAGSIYEVKYPKGVAGIRGSVFDMNLAEGVQNGTITVTCTINMLTGSAVLSFTADGQTTPVTQTILPNFGYNTGTEALLPLTQAQMSQISTALAGMGVTTATTVTVVVPPFVPFVTTTSGQGGTPPPP